MLPQDVVPPARAHRPEAVGILEQRDHGGRKGFGLEAPEHEAAAGGSDELLRPAARRDDDRHALGERLGDDDREVQLAAIGSLGQIGGSASMTILKRLATSGDEIVREAAEEALDEAAFMSNPLGPGARLSGEDWG